MPLQSNSGHHPTPLFWYLGFHGNAILNFINTPKASTHYGEYSYAVSWSWMKEIKKKLKFPLIYFHGNCGKVCPTYSDFFGLSRSTRCGCWQETLLQKFVKFGVNLTFFAPWLPWQRPPFWIFFQTSPPQKMPHTTVDIPTKFHEVWWMESKNVLNPPPLFLFPWQLRKSLSNRFRFFWLISLH